MIQESRISVVKDPLGLNREMKVYLSLLNLMDDVHGDDGKASDLVRLVEGGFLCNAVPAKKFLAGGKPTVEERHFVQRQVLRFLQPKDKYAAFVSVLLKSKAFHTIQKYTSMSTNTHERKVVDLPRTQHKKPYIPVPENLRSELKYGGKEEDMYPISISHQHPFVGIAQLHMAVNYGMENPILVGMDVVVFEECNKRLYSNEEEFFEVFRESFTDREWSLIQAQSATRLQEFYIRWAMKEAYTKALGVGMGIDFSSFDLILPGDIQRDGEGLLGVFTSMTKAGGELYRQQGTLEQEKGNEYWEFAFLPLFETSSLEKPRGCACICAGPLQSPSRTRNLQVCVDWTDLSSLIQWQRTVT